MFAPSMPPELERLQGEIEQQQPNLILALGKTAVWALCGEAAIGKVRGYPMTSTTGRMVLPSWHPAAVLRNYKLRPVMMMDIAKAQRLSASSHLPKQSGFIIIEPSIQEFEEFYHEHIVPAKAVAADIETEGGTITEVGFAVSRDAAINVPFLKRPNKNYWSAFEEEKRAWQLVQLILETKPIIGQNFAYDMKYLWREMGITAPGFKDDTMLMHHALQPEMEKGLGFLGSLYTDRPRWKFMRVESKASKKGD